MTVRARRSLQASSEGINRANKAVLVFATKIDLAAELEISRATVQNFFAGKPVGRENFHKICQKLELPWREVADLPAEPEPVVVPVAPAPQDWDVESLVLEVRAASHASLQQACGLMRVLDMSQPLGLDDIYTNVNILEKISGRRRLDLADLVKVCDSHEFDRPGLGRVVEDRIPGLDVVQKYAKLMVLGKPGAGKTTFLKHIALQCSRGQLLAELVPIFVTLKDFAETPQQPSLLEYIQRQLATCGVTDVAVVEQLLRHGKVLVLLDGLDEVRDLDCYRVLQTVRQFANQFHANRFIISCRLATREYTLEQFTEVEVADFEPAQIASFVTKWFAIADPSKSQKFLQKLRANGQIQELATNPLLLTLLCLVFAESADFPMNRAELYKEGLSVLLKKWDAKRNIEREQIYKQLLLFHKEDLLSQIARQTFERGDYFFTQKALEHHIADYIRHLPGASADLDGLQLDSEAVLKSIEAQHGLLVERARGIYSFSHLTFQEYFTARDIISGADPQTLEVALQQLVCRVTEPRWREVFLLTVGMLRQGDYLLQLMKQQIDQIIASDEQVQALLTWVSQKAKAVKTPYKPVMVRAFYLDLELARVLHLVGGTLDLPRAFDRTFTRALTNDSDLALDLALDRTLALHRALGNTPNPGRALNRVLSRVLSRVDVVAPELGISLQQLKQQLPDADRDVGGFEAWWKANGGAWTEKLRAVMLESRDLGHDWQLSRQQRQVLKQYYDANQLLVDCLNSNCYVTRTVRQEIEETLLVPTADVALSA